MGKGRRTTRTLPRRWDRMGAASAASPRRRIRCRRVFLSVRHRAFISPPPRTRFGLAGIRRERHTAPPVRSRLLLTFPRAPNGLLGDPARSLCRYLYGRWSGALLRPMFAGARREASFGSKLRTRQGCPVRTARILPRACSVGCGPGLRALAPEPALTSMGVA